VCVPLQRQQAGWPTTHAGTTGPVKVAAPHPIRGRCPARPACPSPELPTLPAVPALPVVPPVPSLPSVPALPVPVLEPDDVVRPNADVPGLPGPLSSVNPPLLPLD
jgi:hypothetical protein